MSDGASDAADYVSASQPVRGRSEQAPGSLLPILVAINMAALVLFAVYYVVSERRQNAMIASAVEVPVLVFDRGTFTDEAMSLGIPAAELQKTFDTLRRAARDSGYIVLLNTENSILATPPDRFIRISDFLNIKPAEGPAASPQPAR